MLLVLLMLLMLLMLLLKFFFFFAVGRVSHASNLRLGDINHALFSCEFNAAPVSARRHWPGAPPSVGDVDTTTQQF